MVASSRSKTRAEAAAGRRTTRSAAAAAAASDPSDSKTIIDQTPLSTSLFYSKPVSAKQQISAKTNGQTRTTHPPIATSTARCGVATVGQEAGKDIGKQVYCSCRMFDDGSPMIKCDGPCKTWYHLQCIDLSEEAASESVAFFCMTCESKLGLRSIMDWEGPDAFVDEGGVVSKTKSQVESQSDCRKPLKDLVAVEESEESGDGSEDDYIAEKEKVSKTSTSRLAFRDKLTSDSDSDAERPVRVARRGAVNEKTSSRRKHPLKAFKEEVVPMKRRGSLLTSSSKKARSTNDSPSEDDPMRKYCLCKLNEIIFPMFVEYREQEKKSFVPTSVGLGLDENEAELPSFELSEDEKGEMMQYASGFVVQLEKCMIEEYSEPDKTGRPQAGGKYKERFRMLSFNLAKDDRVALRKGIASGRITPAQLNTMSSTDLANEQTKAEIEAAEAEALQHSIMQKMQAPSAKITHKGIEMIEENMTEARYQDSLKQEEERRESEQRERERLARERQRSTSIALPSTPLVEVGSAPVLHSPIIPANIIGIWGKPPPLPPVSEQPSPSATINRLPTRPLFAPSDSDYTFSTEGELALTDLINIDDDLPQIDSHDDAPSALLRASAESEIGLISTAESTPLSSRPSPFAQSKPTSPARRTSFDLKALWTGGAKQLDGPQDEDDGNRTTKVTVMNQSEDGDDAMEIDSPDEDSEDRTLDAILDSEVSTSVGEPSPSNPVNPPVRLGLHQLPIVWCGTLSMPSDPSNSFMPRVTAKQIGGRTLGRTSIAWNILFPSPSARIDGRVPVSNSSQYLINMRMNVTKELIAICLLPESNEHLKKFNELSDLLIRKSRHGLIFPWGMHPSPEDPGRELYIVPLKKEDSIPECIDLIDNLRLSKVRDDDLLIGVFVLSRGKLRDEPRPEEAGSTSQPDTIKIPSIAAPTSSLSQIPMSSLFANLPRVPGVDQNALAAEVASLTPDQISIMLRTLSQSVSVAAPSATPLPVPVPVPISTASVVSGIPPLGYTSKHTMPSFMPSLPLPSPRGSHHGQSSPRPLHLQSRFSDPKDRYERRQYEKTEDNRGRGRGHRSQRSFGRGRGRDDDRERFRERDSGWRGRGRG